MRQIAACRFARKNLAAERANPLHVVPRMALILALDPGFAAFGAALVDAATGELVDVDVFSTAPNTIKRKRPRKPGAKRRRLPVVGGVARDDDRRVGELAKSFRAFVAEHQIAAAVGESCGGSQDASAARAMGMANAIAAMLVDELWLELERVSVHAWRRTFVPSKVDRAVSDEELYDAIGKQTCDRVRSMLIARGRAGSLWVHGADALAIGRWARNFSSSVRRACGIASGGL